MRKSVMILYVIYFILHVSKGTVTDDVKGVIFCLIILWKSKFCVKISGKCYDLQANDSLRRCDRHTEFFKTSIDCITRASGKLKVIQWLSDITSCRESDRLLPVNTGPVNHALTLVKTNDKFCSGRMMEGKPSRISKDSELLTGKFQKNECGDICMVIKSCKAVTFNKAHMSCEMFRKDGPPILSSDKDFTTFVRQYKGFISPIMKAVYTGNWFARYKLSVDNAELTDKASNRIPDVTTTLQCAVHCFHKSSCRGFSFISSNESRKCILTGTKTTMYIRYEYLIMPG